MYRQDEKKGWGWEFRLSRVPTPSGLPEIFERKRKESFRNDHVYLFSLFFFFFFIIIVIMTVVKIVTEKFFSPK